MKCPKQYFVENIYVVFVSFWLVKFSSCALAVSFQPMVIGLKVKLVLEAITTMEIIVNWLVILFSQDNLKKTFCLLSIFWINRRGRLLDNAVLETLA